MNLLNLIKGMSDMKHPFRIASLTVGMVLATLSGCGHVSDSLTRGDSGIGTEGTQSAQIAATSPTYNYPTSPTYNNPTAPTYNNPTAPTSSYTAMPYFYNQINTLVPNRSSKVNILGQGIVTSNQTGSQVGVNLIAMIVNPYAKTPSSSYVVTLVKTNNAGSVLSTQIISPTSSYASIYLPPAAKGTTFRYMLKLTPATGSTGTTTWSIGNVKITYQ